MLHTFRDGIERDARQHANGGAWITDEATVSTEVFIAHTVEIIGGTFRGGEFWDGEFRGGTFLGGTFLGGTFLGGEFRGGTFRGGEFWDGEFRGGKFRGGTFLGGTFLGGEFRGGEFRGGTFRGGTFRGGEFRGGTVFNSPTFLTGCLPYNVTITDTHAGVGCKWMTHAEWAEQGSAIATAKNQIQADYQLLMMFIQRHKEFCK